MRDRVCEANIADLVTYIEIVIIYNNMVNRPQTNGISHETLGSQCVSEFKAYKK